MSKGSSQRWYSRFSPRLWPFWLGVGLLRVVGLLPHRQLMSLGSLLGRALYLIAGNRRRIAETNISICFPEKSKQERTELLKANFRNLGRMICEVSIIWWGEREKLQKLVHVQGEENIKQALAQGNGVIALAAHFTSLEVGAVILSLLVPCHFMYRPHDDPDMEEFIYNHRMRWFDKSYPRGGVRKMVSSLRQNRVIWYAQDQNTKRSEALFVKFFGRTASTNSATARLAKVTGAVVVPYYVVRREDGSGYDVRFEQPLEGFPSGDIVADTQRVNDIIEKWVRQCPEQYYWVHRRFRTQPNRDDPSPYDA
jgi:KDO2-lipid IV(A) lauroyltransferase